MLSNGADGIYDRIEFKYNRQGEVIEIKDQNETVRAFDYDGLGRRTEDRVVTVGSGVDDAVRRISTTYEIRGLREKLTSWDNATVGSGDVANEVLFTYNDFGQLITEYQAHGGSVNTSTTPKVQYGYADGSTGTIRPTSLTYPSGRVITYDYGAANSMADALSRIASIIDDDVSETHLADYAYLGLGTFVEVDYTEPDIKYTLVGLAGGNDPDSGDIYHGLDRFGRVIDCRWHNYNTATDVDRIKYGYDRNGNRIWRENVVSKDQYGKFFDELYTYDAVDRLQTMARGELTSQNTAIQNKTFAQDWALDPVGNWKNFREDDNGDSTWDLNQQRTANKVNEISNISESVGPAWVTPAYDRAGNMTMIPKPADPTLAFTATYDPWNRLVKIEEPDGMGGTQKLAEYAYDGAKRRTVKKTYSGGSLDQTRYFFYTEPSQWQVVEERVDSSIDPNRQFIWGLRYIDDLNLRDRDNNADGALDERLYALQDANWNVTAVADDSATIAERYAYSAYGTVDTLTGAFATRTTTLYQGETQLSGYRFDRESGLYCVRNRMYSEALGTWLQRDASSPLGDNLYAYCKSRPVSAFDPLGLQPSDLPPISDNPYAPPQTDCGNATSSRIPKGVSTFLAGCFAGVMLDQATKFFSGEPITVDKQTICSAFAGCLAGFCVAALVGGTVIATLTGGLFLLAVAGAIAVCTFAATVACNKCMLSINADPPWYCPQLVG